MADRKFLSGDRLLGRSGILIAIILLATESGRAKTPPDNPYWSVALAQAENGQLTLQIPIAKGFRKQTFPLPVGDASAEDLQMSKTGTKVVVVLKGKAYIGDLTGPVPAWDRCRQYHQLPEQKYAIRLTDRIVVLSDDSFLSGCPTPSNRAPMAPPLVSERRETTVPSPPALGINLPIPADLKAAGLWQIGTPVKAMSVAVDDAGTILYADANEQLWRVTADKATYPVALPSKVGSDGFIRVVLSPIAVGKPERRLTFRVVVCPRGSGCSVYEVEDSGQVSNQPLNHFPVSTGRAIAIAVTRGLPNAENDNSMTPSAKTPPGWHFVPPQAPAPVGASIEPDWEVLTTTWINWWLTYIHADPSIYAPVLEMDESEKIYPSPVTIWDYFPAGGPEAITVENITHWYQQLLTDAQRQTGVYYQIHNNLPGSWLIEYWTYYAADTGRVEGHIHDTEHTFVEVDRLVCRPRAILSAAHNGWNPSNIYSSLDPGDADIPFLPIFTFVEANKHAMAPDVNHDGFVTFGADINTYRERAHLWGMRDYIGRTDAHTDAWVGDMATPRKAQYRLANQNFGLYYAHRFVELQLTQPQCAYQLIDFNALPPPIPPVNSTASAIQSDAVTQLTNHAEHLNPSLIYRTHVFPDFAVRYSASYDSFRQQTQVSLGVAVSLMRPFGLTTPVPLPGVVSVEFGCGLTKGNSSACCRKFIGIGYEKMLTNLFGVQFASQTQLGTPAADQRRTDIEFGPMMIVAPKGMNRFPLILHAGPTWNGNSNGGLGFNVGVAVNLLSEKGRHHFGIP